MTFLVATTSLPAVDRPNADRWNAARSCQLLQHLYVFPPLKSAINRQNNFTILYIFIVPFPSLAGIKCSISCHVGASISCCVLMLHLITSRIKATIL